MASDAEGGRERDGGGGEGGAAAAVAEEAVWYLLRLHDRRRCKFWLHGFPAYKASVAGHSPGDDDRRRKRRHRDQGSSASSAMLSSSAASSHLPPPPPPVVAPPPVFLALGACRACVPYIPGFQGIDSDLRVAGEELAMRDAVGVLGRLGTRDVGAEAGELGVRGEMWSLSYVGFWTLMFIVCRFGERKHRRGKV